MKLLTTGFLLLLFSAVVFAQKTVTERPDRAASSAAFAEVLLKKTELQAELEGLSVEYTEEYPKVGELKHSIEMLDVQIGRLNAVKASDMGKLTAALGKLMVKKAELDTELWVLLKTYKEGHPDVKKAQKKVDIFEAAIKQILGS